MWRPPRSSRAGARRARAARGRKGRKRRCRPVGCGSARAPPSRRRRRSPSMREPLHAAASPPPCRGPWRWSSASCSMARRLGMWSTWWTARRGMSCGMRKRTALRPERKHPQHRYPASVPQQASRGPRPARQPIGIWRPNQRQQIWTPQAWIRPPCPCSTFKLDRAAPPRYSARPSPAPSRRSRTSWPQPMPPSACSRCSTV